MGYISESFESLSSLINKSSLVSLNGSVCIPDDLYHKWFGLFVKVSGLESYGSKLLFDSPVFPFPGVLLDLLNDCLVKRVGQGVSGLVGLKRESLSDRDSFDLLGRKLYELIGDSVIDVLEPSLTELFNEAQAFYSFSYENRSKIFGSPLHLERVNHYERVLSSLIK